MPVHSKYGLGSRVDDAWQGGCLRRLALIALGLAAGAGHVTPSPAADYPSRPIKLVVPFPPGGGTDMLSRTLGNELGEALHTAVVVESRPGAATNIATAYVANQPADGYTLLTGTVSFAANSSLYKNLPYRPEQLQPLALLANSPSLLAVRADSKFQNAKQLVAEGRAHPDALNYASWGVGSSAHLAAELFRQTTGSSMTHIPYPGGGPAITSVLAGQTQFVFSSVLPVQGFLKAGKMRALGIAAEGRSTALPDVPTFNEQGIPLVTGAWFGVFITAGTPPPVVAVLEAGLKQAIGRAQVRQSIERDGAVPGYVDHVKFAGFVEQERQRWAAVIKAAKIPPE
ncbi:MAG: tripartite tricarboxylate transporter substrate binding protein [Betaproteobacteria bacterium]|nr:tripartite tricarboxylate transporter substrate binding protein [Betaproteobacteria bacterium]